MPYKVSVEPSDEPVSVAELKSHLRITDTSREADIAALITAARQHIEGLTRRPMVKQTIVATFPRWPENSILVLPVGNVLAITSLKYWPDPASTQQTVTSTNYVVVTAESPGKIVLVDTYSVPDLYDRSDAIEVTLTAGYGNTATSVPEALKMAVKALAGYWHEQPLPVNIGNIVNPMPMHVQAIINQFRVIAPEV